MGKIYKRGSVYWARYQDSQGNAHRESLGTKDLAVAKVRLRERELARPADHAAATTLRDALKHLLEVAYAGRAKDTVKSYTQKARHVLRLLGRDTPIGTITRAGVQQYRAARLAESAASTSVHKELVVLRLALAEQGVTGVVPRTSGTSAPRVRHLTDAQFEAVMGRLNPKRRLWLLLACYTGLRDKELNNLDWADVDLKHRVVLARGTKTAGSFRRVPLNPEAHLWLCEAWLPDEPARGLVTLNWTNRRRDICVAYWKVLGLKIPNPRKKESSAGMPRISPNDLRRTFASWLKNDGVDSAVVARLLGHKSTRMVDRVYGQLDMSTLQAAVARLPTRTANVPQTSPNQSNTVPSGTDSPEGN